MIFIYLSMEIGIHLYLFIYTSWTLEVFTFSTSVKFLYAIVSLRKAFKNDWQPFNSCLNLIE